MNRPLSECLAEEAQALLSLSALEWRATLDRPDARACVEMHLVQSYHYVRWSVPLLKRCLAAIPSQMAELRAYLTRHVHEETGHDVWLLEDLERLGFSRLGVMASTPMPEIAALVDEQIDAIAKARPYFFLGYMFVLESSAGSPSSHDDLADRVNMPRAALSTFRRHAVVDAQEHIVALSAVLDREITDRTSADEVFRGACATSCALTRYFRSLVTTGPDAIDAALLPMRARSAGANESEWNGIDRGIVPSHPIEIA
jgi:hypothetical protein